MAAPRTPTAGPRLAAASLYIQQAAELDGGIKHSSREQRGGHIDRLLGAPLRFPCTSGNYCIGHNRSVRAKNNASVLKTPLWRSAVRPVRSRERVVKPGQHALDAVVTRVVVIPELEPLAVIAHDVLHAELEMGT